MKLAIVQLKIKWEDTIHNLKRAEDFVKKAGEDNCDVIVFPEMFNTGFSMNIDNTAENSDGFTSRKLSFLSNRYHVAIIAGYTEKTDHTMAKNVASIYDKSGSLVIKYTKMHPFSFAHEDRYFDSGDRSVVFHLCDVPSSIFICYDLRFPELFRTVATESQVMYVIANWPSTRIEHWESLLKARAIENQCYIVGVNRIGEDGNKLAYCGKSHVFSPLGKDLYCADENHEYFTVQIDPEEVVAVRSKFPFLKDIRGTISF